MSFANLTVRNGICSRLAIKRLESNPWPGVHAIQSGVGKFFHQERYVARWAERGMEGRAPPPES